MRDSSTLALFFSRRLALRDETRWSLTGSAMGFIAWLIGLGLPFMYFGTGMSFILLYTWPFFLALLPVAIVTGTVFHTLLHKRLYYSIIATLLSVILMCIFLLLWLTG